MLYTKYHIYAVFVITIYRYYALGWKAANRGPLYQPYLQVNFGNVTRVTEIILTAPSGITLDVPVDSLKYDVYTSNDNYVWTHIELVSITT